MAITLEETTSGYVLRQTDAAGAVIQMNLTEGEALSLSVSAAPIQRSVAARRTRAGAVAVELVPVVRLKAETDVHKSDLHLTFETPSGARQAFLLSRDLGKLLIQEIAAWWEQVQSHRPATH